jgi:sulfhydrogenase subunit beta (sulfur reductase)
LPILLISLNDNILARALLYIKNLTMLFIFLNFIIICEKKNNKVEDVVQISDSNWHLFLKKISNKFDVIVPVKKSIHIEYEFFDTVNLQPIYNKPIPVTPLKTFFLPVKENLVINKKSNNKKIIIGIPSCDLKALELLDEIYLDNKYPDPKYKEKRDDTILIGTDCHDIAESCHCLIYGVEPYPTVNADATLVSLNGELIITIKTLKGKNLITLFNKEFPLAEPAHGMLEMMEARRQATRERLIQQNADLPDYKTTGRLISASTEEIWIRHASTCVSCGACATICPTCTCFLLVDRPDFDKVRQLDACQYPGFERIAAGEDPLVKKPVRFRNRYMCKYVWKPEKFKSLACTGCGRCIDSCLGNISKNKIFTEMLKTS